MTVGWDARNPFDMDCGAPGFESFVENVLRLEPAWCSRMFEDYVGRTPADEINFVGATNLSPMTWFVPSK